ncbi:MAG TPA: AI-2E family transporter [Polyangiaceae bacterium]|nr:AI-2E family transporter [Polyangiaceae bacterium]
MVVGSPESDTKLLRGVVTDKVALRAEQPAAEWRDLFYLYAFLDVSISHRGIERRERVWIRRFLAHRGKRNLFARMEEIILLGGPDQLELKALFERAANELSTGEKRRFMYNLAQLFESKSKLSAPEYEKLLDVAERIGISDMDADSMIRSVFSVTNTFVAIMGVLAIGTILYLTRSVIIPLVVAILMTMIINKVEGRLRSAFPARRLRWVTKLGATMVVLAVFFGLATAGVVSATDIVNRFPDYQVQFTKMMEASSGVQTAVGWLRTKGLLGQLQQLPIGEMVTSFLGSLVVFTGNIVLVVIFTGFMVFSSSRFTGLLQEMNDTIGAYMVVKTLMCLLTGAIFVAMCWMFGVDFALFWGLLAFLLNFIPTVGSIIATLPLVLLATIQLQSWTSVAFFAAILLVVQQFIGQILEPKLMGLRLSLKPVAILLGLIFWGLLWGIPGMFLATPLMVLIRIVSSYFNVTRGFERLLASETT